MLQPPFTLSANGRWGLSFPQGTQVVSSKWSPGWAIDWKGINIDFFSEKWNQDLFILTSMSMEDSLEISLSSCSKSMRWRGSTILAGNFAEAGPDNDIISKYSRWLPCTFSYSVWREGMLGGISRGIRSVGSSELSSHACTHASATWTLASPSRGHWHSNRTQQVPFSRLGVGRRAQLCITEGEDLLALLFFSPPTDPPLSPQLMEEECVQNGGDKFSICAV